MATTTIKQVTTETHYISIEQDNAVLTVTACPLMENKCFCGFPTDKATYHYTEIKKAVATFNRYRRKYKGE